MKTNTNCEGKDLKLAEMLLDPGHVPAKVQAHVAECESCTAELANLTATMNLLDTWQAPEPSPYFMTRLGARMREERAAGSKGWLAARIAHVRNSLMYGQGLQVRPLAAVSLTVMLLVGGGTYLGISDWMQPVQQTSQNAAVVHDLQTIDSNSQVLDQMEALTDNSGGD